MPKRVAGPASELLPDFPVRNNPGVLQAKNVIPSLMGYRPANDLVGTGKSIANRCRGAASMKGNDGTLYSFAGDETELYRLGGASYVSATSGAPYTLNEEDNWDFMRFFNNAIAANGQDPLQVLTNFAGTFADIVIDVSTTTPAPDARYIAPVRNFIMTGSQPNNRNRIQWCAIGDHTIWDPTVQQAGLQDLQTGGDITGVVGGEYGVVFLEDAIYRLNYTGDPNIVFQVDDVEGSHGSQAPGSIVKHGSLIFFIDTDGFYVFDGAKSHDLGSAKLNRTFRKDYDESYAHRVTSVIDTKRNLVLWGYPSKLSSGGLPDKIMAYDILSRRFAGPIEVETELLTQTASDTAALLDDFLSTNPLFAAWPTLTPPELDSDSAIAAATLVDDSTFKGGSITISAFNNLHELATFTGPVLPPLIETSEINLIQGGRALVTGFRVVVDGDADLTTTVRVGSRDKTKGPVTWTGYLTPFDDTELADCLVDARYHRFEINITGDFDFIVGGEPEYEDAGFR